MKNRTRVALIVILLVSVLMATSGCVKKKMVEKYKDVEPDETAFVIQLEGSIGSQRMVGGAELNIASPEEWEKYIVNSARIPISQRWKSLGHMYWNGVYIETTRVITVNRSDVAREWDASPEKGTSGKNEALVAESRDSIGFSVPLACTANISRADAATFLFYYKGDSLAKIMDSVVRNRAQTIVAKFCNKHNMTDLRGKKSEIVDAVKKDFASFFPSRGISITNVGFCGEFTYRDKEIQKAINRVFSADQKIAEEDKLQQAQVQANIRIESLATAEKNASISKGQGVAEAISLKASAEALGIIAIKDAARGISEEAITMKMLENQKLYYEQWNGVKSQYVLGDDMNMLMQLPSSASNMSR